MFCRQCGFELVDEASFCTRCGAPRDVPQHGGQAPCTRDDGAGNPNEARVPERDLGKRRADAHGTSPQAGHRKASATKFVVGGIVGVLVLVGAVFGWQYYGTHRSVSVPVYIEAPGYESASDSKIPLHVSGQTVGGESIDRDFYLDEAASASFQIPRGSYEVTVPASPLMENGHLFETDAVKEEIVVSDLGAKKKNSSEPLSIQFTVMDPSRMTDDALGRARAAAIESGMTASRVDELAKSSDQIRVASYSWDDAAGYPVIRSSVENDRAIESVNAAIKRDFETENVKTSGMFGVEKTNKIVVTRFSGRRATIYESRYSNSSGAAHGVGSFVVRNFDLVTGDELSGFKTMDIDESYGCDLVEASIMAFEREHEGGAWTGVYGKAKDMIASKQLVLIPCSDGLRVVCQPYSIGDYASTSTGICLRVTDGEGKGVADGQMQDLRDLSVPVTTRVKLYESA